MGEIAFALEPGTVAAKSMMLLARESREFTPMSPTDIANCICKPSAPQVTVLKEDRLDASSELESVSYTA